MAKRNSHIYRRVRSGDVWQYRYTDENGVLRRKTSGSTVYQIAIDLWTAATKRVQDIKAGRLPAEQQKIVDKTLGELCKAYLEFCQGEGQKRYIPKNAVLPLFEKKYGSKTPIKTMVKQKFFEDYKHDLLKEGLIDSTKNKRRIKRGEKVKGMSNGGVRDYLNMVKAMFRKAEEWEWLPYGQIEKALKKFKNPKGGKRISILSVEEIERLLPICPPKLRVLTIHALHTGMRRGEIIHLKKTAVDRAHGFFNLTVYDEVNKTEANRKIQIDETMEALLDSLPPNDSEYVYADEQGKPLKHIIRNTWTRVCKKAGLANYQFRDNRHTFASHYIMNGGSILALQEILGHTDPKTTMIYLQYSDKYRLKARVAMNEMPGKDLVGDIGEYMKDARTTKEQTINKRTGTKLTHHPIKSYVSS